MHTIDIYADFVYQGFWGYNKVNELFTKYSLEAENLSENIDENEVVLYAIFYYEKKSHAMITADFMNIKIDYDSYVALADKIKRNCRIFFNGGPCHKTE